MYRVSYKIGNALPYPKVLLEQLPDRGISYAARSPIMEGRGESYD